MDYCDYLPSIKNLSYNSIQDAIQSSVIQVKNEIYTVNEPEDLRPTLNFEAKQLEIEANLLIFEAASSNMRKQRELNSKISQSICTMGRIFQRIKNADSQETVEEQKDDPRFYSDAGVEDLDNEQENCHQQENDVQDSADDDYTRLEHLQGDSTIYRMLKSYSDIIEHNNPSTLTSQFLKENAIKLQGVLQAFIDRKSYIKTFVKKEEIRNSKKVKLDQR